MLFNSLSFVAFLIIVLALYYSKIFGWTGKKRMLLISSYIFYGMWNPPLLLMTNGRIYARLRAWIRNSII